MNVLNRIVATIHDDASLGRLCPETRHAMNPLCLHLQIDTSCAFPFRVDIRIRAGVGGPRIYHNGVVWEGVERNIIDVATRLSEPVMNGPDRRTRCTEGNVLDAYRGATRWTKGGTSHFEDVGSAGQGVGVDGGSSFCIPDKPRVAWNDPGRRGVNVAAG